MTNGPTGSARRASTPALASELAARLADGGVDDADRALVGALADYLARTAGTRDGSHHPTAPSTGLHRPSQRPLKGPALDDQPPFAAELVVDHPPHLDEGVGGEH